jgi:CHAD domain-containing protein
MTTNRTAIRRRLAVGRRTHRPPRGAWKAGHRSILAPLAATVAATVAVGVGVVLARAERERRVVRSRRRERKLGLGPGEPLAEALPRMAVGQIDIALELLAPDRGASDAHVVHETRKAIKRLRALLRLLEHQLGKKEYARDSDALRELAQRLSGARDAEVMRATLDGLIDRHPRALGRRAGVRQLRGRLLAEQTRMEQLALGSPTARSLALAELSVLRERIAAWSLPDRPGLQLVERDMKKLYRHGQERHQRVLRGKGDQVRAMHEWRKRVKDLRYATEMLRRRDSRKRRRADERLRKLAKRADALGELLGEDHDLAVLAQRLRAGRRAARQDTWHTGRKTRKALLKAIAKRRKTLRKRALRDGARLYRRSPKRLLAQLGA